MLKHAVAACVAITLMSGCSSIKTYPNDLARNFYVTTKLDSSSVMTKSEAVVDIFRINAKCETTHEGRVELDPEKKADIGLPTNTPLYIEFIFVNSTRLGNNVTGIRSGFFFTARPGYKYQAAVAYDRGIYDATLRETGKGGSRVIDSHPLSACKAS